MAYAAPVVAVGTSNVNISNLSSAVFDGITVTSGQRVLLVGQTNQAQNGVQIFNGTGMTHPMTRPTTNNDQYQSGNVLDNNTTG